jgi:hypothetical protein
MRRTRIYLLVIALAAVALAAVHAAVPRAAQANDTWHLWETKPDGETCSGTCGTGQKCCRIVVAPAPPP